MPIDFRATSGRV